MPRVSPQQSRIQGCEETGKERRWASWHLKRSNGVVAQAMNAVGLLVAQSGTALSAHQIWVSHSQTKAFNPSATPSKKNVSTKG